MLAMPVQCLHGGARTKKQYGPSIADRSLEGDRNFHRRPSVRSLNYEDRVKNITWIARESDSWVKSGQTKGASGSLRPLTPRIEMVAGAGFEPATLDGP